MNVLHLALACYFMLLLAAVPFPGHGLSCSTQGPTCAIGTMLLHSLQANQALRHIGQLCKRYNWLWRTRY